MSNTSAETPEEGKWEASEQKGKPGHCFCAQVFGVNGKSIVMIEPTENPDDASELAKRIANMPSLEMENAELKADAEKWFKKYNEMSELAFNSANKASDQAETIKRYKALVSAQEGYIQFLSHHIDSQTQFMAIHNQFASAKDIERGELFRESIAAAKSALSGTNE